MFERLTDPHTLLIALGDYNNSRSIGGGIQMEGYIGRFWQSPASTHAVELGDRRQHCCREWSIFKASDVGLPTSEEAAKQSRHHRRKFYQTKVPFVAELRQLLNIILVFI
jgi:hypothetical protein